MERNLYYHKMEKKMILPSGIYYGSLPDHIIISGVEWIATATGIVEGITYDKLINSETREMKTIKREKLLKFLESEQHKE
jgi:hypothetical protein